VHLIIKVLINAAALWVAARFIPGITLEGSVWSILLVALVFGLLNAFLKPILKLFSLPLLIVTLGLFAIIINVAVLGITAALMDNFSIDGFWPALLASLVISIVSAILNKVLTEKDRGR